MHEAAIDQPLQPEVGQAEDTSSSAAQPRLLLVTLHLARCRDYPDGSVRCGYQFTAPLDASHHLDVDSWKAARQHCLVRRFWIGDEDRQGRLVHRRGGLNGATWAFVYANGGAVNGEVEHFLHHQVFQPGEYVSIEDEDGAVNTFKVETVKEVMR